MTVLIVDDEKVVAESTAEIFRLSGHEALYATNAHDALAIGRQFRPQLLITDVVMPKETGIDLAIKLVAEVPSCKVLLISGQAETSDLLESAKQQGHNFEILAKPLWPPDLLRRAMEIVVEGNTSSDAAAASK